MCHLVKARQAILSDRDGMKEGDHVTMIHEMTRILDKMAGILLPNLPDDVIDSLLADGEPPTATVEAIQ